MKLKEDKCPLCGRKVEEYGLCHECLGLINRDPAYYYDIEGLDDLIVASTYSGIMRRLIIDFKFKGKVSYGEIISEIMTEKILDKNLNKEVITFVPMHKNKEGERATTNLNFWQKKLQET